MVNTSTPTRTGADFRHPRRPAEGDWCPTATAASVGPGGRPPRWQEMPQSSNGLARAVGAEDAEGLGFLDGERHVVHGDSAPRIPCAGSRPRDRKSVVEGKRVDFGCR